MAQQHPNILIGGTSHVGKTTLAHALGTALGRDVLATDQMARHPGRPWPTVRPHVAEFYTSLSQESIFTFLLHHHGNMWPNIESLLAERIRKREPCILEGSALRPEFLAKLSKDQNTCFCLIASEAFIKERIHTNSDYANLATASRQLVDVFLARSLKDNAAIKEAAKLHSIECIDTANPKAMARLKDRVQGR